jgi:hypothetical protein
MILFLCDRKMLHHFPSVNTKRYNGNDPKITRVIPLPQGNHVAKFGKDPIYRTKVIVRKRSCCQKFYL